MNIEAGSIEFIFPVFFIVHFEIYSYIMRSWGLRTSGLYNEEESIMRISIGATAVVLAAATLMFGCSDKDEDTGDTSVEEAVDTAGEELE